MDQHVLSRWLLASFARRELGRRVLSAYDKETGEYSDHDADEFLTERDAHSGKIESAISQLETPAAAAARRLGKLVRGLPPGLYAVMDKGSEVRKAGPQLSDKGVYGGLRLLVSERTIPSPTQADRVALCRYAGLMYQRAPATETAILRLGRDYVRAAQGVIDQFLPGVKADIPTDLESRRARLPEVAAKIAARLASANWLVVRAGVGESFVLGDCPVAATSSLGHDADDWMPIFASASFVVVMPLRPTVTLLMAPQRIVPISSDIARIPAAINRLMWRSADRFVLANTRAALEAAWPEADDAQRRQAIRASHDEERTLANAERDARGIVEEVLRRRTGQPPWPPWDGCRLDFGIERRDLPP